jgi:hypothetical protein
LLSPADLLDQAEEFSSRIPAGDDYVEDRNISWLAIGQAWLKLGDGAGAMRALSRLDHPRCQAVLRHAIAMWTGDHPEFEAGRELSRETAVQIAQWEPAFSRSDVTDLVAPIHRIFGEELVREMAAGLTDRFTASNVLVTLSHFVRDVGVRQDTLESAEHLASSVRAGDRDFALRWVYNGFRAAGCEADAQRILASMTMAPKQMDDPMLAAEKALEAAEQLLAQYNLETLVDTALARLRRYIEYKFNDLNVRLLADLAEAGGVADADVEQILLSDMFHAIQPPRAPSVGRDVSNLDASALADFVFRRPVILHDADQQLLEGSDCFDEGARDDGFARRVLEMFENFGSVAPRYSMEQIDQGLWLLLSGPLCVRLDLECSDRMLNPFRDYYAHCGEHYTGTAFYMWWDLIRPGAKALSVLEQILALPSAACQRAALHGLNHLRPDPRASELVARYIERNRSSMTPEELEYAEMCRDGRAQ